MELNINTGSKGPECCLPSALKDSEPSVYYPSFHYSGEKPLKIPKEGEMVVRYKKVESSENDRGDSPRYSCTIEIREIVSADAEVEAPAKNRSEASDALDAILRDKISKMKGEEDDTEENEDY